MNIADAAQHQLAYIGARARTRGDKLENLFAADWANACYAFGYRNPDRFISQPKPRTNTRKKSGGKQRKRKSR